MPYLKKTFINQTVMARLVVDTNSIIQSLPRKSRYHTLWVSLFDGINQLCVSNEILEEYEEIIARKTTSNLASNVVRAILNNPYTLFISPYFRFKLIESDPDDNKFVDCAVVANAKFIVTSDRHFEILKKIDFPKVDIISLDEVMTLLI